MDNLRANLTENNNRTHEYQVPFASSVPEYEADAQCTIKNL